MSMRTGAFAAVVVSALCVAPAFAQAPLPSPIDPGAVEDLVAANRILADQQVLDAYGHVSVRVPGNPQRFLMGRNLAPALVTADDIVEYDLDGTAIGAKPGFTHFLERFIHAEIYRARPDVVSVIHSHAPSLLPFANTPTPLKPMFHVSGFIGPGAPVFEIRKAAEGPTNMLIGDGKLGKALADVLGQNAIVLMRGHGWVVVAPSIPLAVFRAVYAEVNARAQAQAISFGGPIVFLDPAEAERANKVMDQVHTRAWELWKRKISTK